MQNFSLWCDFIERGFLQNDFGKLLDSKTFNGATSNPSIFSQAILTSPFYKDQIKSLKGESPKAIYETLAIEDIKLAAKLLYPLYEANKDNGYISIEIDPTLSDDIKASIDEGKRLYETIGCENVMIKVPATNAGYEVIKALYENDINVNATLIFSPEQAHSCAQAFSIDSNARAVISVFVSRFDSLIPQGELPKLGILNAMICYEKIKAFKNPNLRTLFASTSTKSESLPKDYYITNLLAPDSINTAPLATIQAFLNNPSKRTISLISSKEANDEITKILENSSFTINTIYEKLLNDGLVAFKESFAKMLKSLESI